MARACVAAALVSACLSLSAARLSAQPSIWDRARSPREHRSYQLQVAVERMMAHAVESDALDPTLRPDFTRAALALFELAGGDEELAPNLGYLFGRLLVQSELPRHVRARRVLEHALQQEPDSPLASQGWFDLAIACAKQGDLPCEQGAYGVALDVTWESDRRATVFLNRGEAAMLSGNLPAALRDYRAALGLAAAPAISALAYYGLGVALDRNGDLPAALDAMRSAEAIPVVVNTPLGPVIVRALHLPDVFFIPAYDVHYYDALVAMSAARDASDGAERQTALGLAVRHWADYLAPAEAAADRWLATARVRKAQCEARIAKLEAEAAKGRPAPRAARRRRAAVAPALDRP